MLGRAVELPPEGVPHSVPAHNIFCPGIRYFLVPPAPALLAPGHYPASAGRPVAAEHLGQSELSIGTRGDVLTNHRPVFSQTTHQPLPAPPLQRLAVGRQRLDGEGHAGGVEHRLAADQSGVSINTCQPIRTQYCHVSTNQELVFPALTCLVTRPRSTPGWRRRRGWSAASRTGTRSDQSQLSLVLTNHGSP